jgi:hypothetical protein
MTGSKLTELLREARIEQRSTESTKWRRLRDDLGAGQRRDGNGNAAARFIQLAIAPVRLGSDPAGYDEQREALNLILAKVFAAVVGGHRPGPGRTEPCALIPLCCHSPQDRYS